MRSGSTVVSLCQPDAVEVPLTAALRSVARRLLAQAVEAEAEAFLATVKDMRLPDGRDRLVRHGHGPERLVQTGIGPVEVRRVKLRDRGAREGAECIRFTSAILPRWARRTRSLDALLPILYLRGVSTSQDPMRGLDRNAGPPSGCAGNALDFADSSAVKLGDLGNRHAVLHQGADARANCDRGISRVVCGWG